MVELPERRDPSLLVPFGGQSGFPLLLILAVTGLGTAALSRQDETIDRPVALSGMALVSLTVGLCLARGASFETLVAFVGAMGCLAGVLFVSFPWLHERARAVARAGDEPPPGWHDDPAGGPGVRWWDGRAWTQIAHGVEAPETAPVKGSTARYPRQERTTDVRS